MELYTLIDWWPLLLLGLLGGLIVLLSLFLGFRRFRARPKASKKRRRSPLVRLVILLGISTLFLSGLCIVLGVWGLVSNFYSYRVLSRLEQVAEVRCLEPESPTDEGFRISYTPVVGGELGKPREYLLRGEQWLLGSDIVKWRSYMNYLGFHTHFKITRLEGRYLVAGDQSQKTITAFALNGGTDPVWAQLYRTGSAWPFSYFIDDVYGSAVYQFADPGSTFDIFISTSGLVARRR